MVRFLNVKVEKRELRTGRTDVNVVHFNPGKSTIARVQNSGHGKSDAEQIATLFAAAPELLGALKLAKYLIENPSPSNIKASMEIIVDAIKKAEH